MKKTIIPILIIVLILTAIGLTSYVFFINYKKDKDKEVSLIGFSQNISRQQLVTGLNKTISLIEEENAKKSTDAEKDFRFNTITATLINLEDIMDDLTSYYISNNYVIKNETIANSVRAINSNVILANNMTHEYNEIKSKSTYFDRYLGANDLYRTISNYIVNYSNLINLVNKNISVNKYADIKFSMIDAYCNVCIDTFSNIDLTKDLYEVKSVENLAFINTYFSLNNGTLNIAGEAYNVNTNLFINNYQNCNKQDFAKHLKSYTTNATSLSACTTNELITAFYFKEVYGI